MLRELHISNLAVIEDVTIELAPGLNCFTGQTGAGKSLVLGAFEVLLGLRGGAVADLLRPGAEEARVSGVFELADPATARQIAAAADLTLEPGEPLLVTRKLFASGRSSVSLNGQPATTAMVRAIGELLVDVHGQHDHQYLLKPSNQLLILDTFGRSLERRERFAALYAQRRGLLARQAELTASRTLRRQQLELFEFQAGEIDHAEPVEGEFAALKERHARLSNVQRIQKEAGGAHAALYEAEGAVVERLQMIAHVLGELALVDPQLAAVAEQVRTSTLTLQDSAFELGRYLDRLDLDPGQLAEVEDRLNTLNRLVAKYASRALVLSVAGTSTASGAPGTTGAGAATPPAGDDPLAAVLAYRADLERQLHELRGQNEDLAGLDDQIAAADKELAAVGRELSEARRAAAAKLRPLVEAELHELGMAEAKFEVAFDVGETDEAAGCLGQSAAMPQTKDAIAAKEAGASKTSGGQPQAPALAAGVSGLDTIEMLVQTNPGQPARPLRKIASGGELSRIMLALKSILAQSDRVSVLVFDEIDANIGGRMGTVIGRKLRRLAASDKGKGQDGCHGLTGVLAGKPCENPPPGPRHGLPRRRGQTVAPRAASGGSAGGHQVLCITHLPQIAAFADRHLRIAKEVAGKGAARQTRTTVSVLQGDQRVDELAEMLAGKEATQTTRTQARELLAAAENG